MSSEQSNKRNPDLLTKFRASHSNSSRPRSKTQKSTPKRAQSECCEEATTSVDDDEEEDVTGEAVVSGEEHLVSFMTNQNGYYASPTAPGVVTTTPLNEKNSMIYDFPSHHHHNHHHNHYNHYLQSHNNQSNNNSVNHNHVGDQIIASSTSTSDNLILDLEFDHYYAPHGQDVATFVHADYNSIS